MSQTSEQPAESPKDSAESELQHEFRPDYRLTRRELLFAAVSSIVSGVGLGCRDSVEAYNSLGPDEKKPIVELGESVSKKITNWIEDPGPMPERQPECDYFLDYQSQIQPDGIRWYWVDGKWFPEPLVKSWFFEKQIEIIDKKIAAVDAKIKLYQDEIYKIDSRLTSKGRGEVEDDVKEADLRRRIDALTAELQNLRDVGLIPTDVEYRRRFHQIKNLQDQLSTKTPSYESTWHITTWPLQPGGPDSPGQNLYTLMSNHRAAIERIKLQERVPFEVQRDRNRAHLNYWQGVHEKFLKE